jgi:hypothetical protein
MTIESSKNKNPERAKMTIKLLVLRPDQIPDFRAAIKHNSMTATRQLAERRLCDQDYYFVKIVKNQYVLQPPGSHNMQTARKIDDYLAGAIVGALPFNDLQGDDALMVREDGTTSLVELKLSMKDPYRYWLGQRGGLNAGQDVKGRRVSIRSDCSASYKIVDNLDKKNIDTYFVMVDSRNWRVVCVYHMTGDKVMEYLTLNHINGLAKICKERSIKLGTFASSGTEFTPENMSVMGLELWEAEIRRRCHALREIESSMADLNRHFKIRNFPGFSDSKWYIRQSIKRIRKSRLLIHVI